MASPTAKLWTEISDAQFHLTAGKKTAESSNFEGLDVGFQFVTTRAAGKHDAGNEGAEGGRKTDRIHEKGSADDEREGGSRTSFAPSSERHPAQAQVVYGMPDRNPSVSKQA